MSQTVPTPTPDADAPAYLDCERLDCYRVAVQFQVFAAGLCRRPRIGALRDQLDRASVSIVLNIAEGAGRTTGPDKAHFFAIARGSATECAAVLDLMVARGFPTVADHRHGRGMLIRVVQMLTRMAARVGRSAILLSSSVQPVFDMRRAGGREPLGLVGLACHAPAGGPACWDGQ